MQPAQAKAPLSVFNIAIIIIALGYLVDVYDMLIFNVTRVTSLTELGLSGTALTDAGLFIINMQMAGFILGGLFFGILGDRLGRKQSLLGSIAVYSTATLGCAFVQDVTTYGFLRLIAGFGLAGEVGVGVTLITECMCKTKRTLGVTLFGVIGISGAVIAAALAEFLPWRSCYIIGGTAGILLMLFRSSLLESHMFEELKGDCTVKRGNILDILKNKQLLHKYICGVLLGCPIFFFIGMVWTLAPEISKSLGSVDVIKGSIAIGAGYSGLMLGDVLAGLLSQYFKSRKKVVVGFIGFAALLFACFLNIHAITSLQYYILAGFMGVSIGYWVNLITLSAEQFGTNLRATAATSIPNFARATLLPMNLLLGALKPEMGILMATSIVGLLAMGLALYAIKALPETFDKDLNYQD